MGGNRLLPRSDFWNSQLATGAAMHASNRRAASLFGLSLAGLALAGCGDGKQNAPQASAPPPAVTVVKVASADVKSTASFTGRVEAMFKVDLRARVDGFLEKRLFKEGADVKEGELLFVIEKGLYQAAVD